MNGIFTSGTSLLSSIKPATLSCQFQGEDKTTNRSDSIPLIPCGVSVLTWEVEEWVRSATEGQSGPSAYPPNHFCSLSPEVRCHPVGPHPIQRIGDVILQCFWWSREFVNACPLYNQHKPSSQAPAGFLQALYSTSSFVQHLSGLLNSLPPSDGNTTILTMVDHFSRIAHFVPLSKLSSAKKTARLVLLHIFQLHGLLVDMVLD